MVGLLFNTVAGVYTLYQLRQRERSIDKKDGESLVESKRLERCASPHNCTQYLVEQKTKLTSHHRRKTENEL